MLRYIMGVPIFLPLSVCTLAVEIERPRRGVDGVDEHILPQHLHMVVVVDGSGVAVVLKQDVGDKIMIVGVMTGSVLQDCQAFLLSCGGSAAFSVTKIIRAIRCSAGLGCQPQQDALEAFRLCRKRPTRRILPATESVKLAPACVGAVSHLKKDRA